MALTYAGIAAQGGHVGHAGVHVHGPHGVADGLVLLQDGLVVLHVFVAVVDGEGIVGGVAFALEVMPPLVEEELGQFEVGAVSRDPIELGQADFDLLVAGEGPLLARAERANQKVGVLDRDIQEAPLPRSRIMGRGRFIHVADVVEFVADPQVGPAFFSRAGRGMEGIDRPVGVDVSVRLLGLADDEDQDVQPLLEAGVGMEHERVGRGFHDLEDVRVVIALALEGPFHQAAGLAEVVHPPGLLVLVQGEGHRGGAVGLHLRRPENVVDMDPGEGHGLDGIIGSRRSLSLLILFPL